MADYGGTGNGNSMAAALDANANKPVGRPLDPGAVEQITKASRAKSWSPDPTLKSLDLNSLWQLLSQQQ
jgi:hypothetical protein